MRTASRLAELLAVGEVGCLDAGTYVGDVVLDRSRTVLRSAPGARARLELHTLEIAEAAEDVQVRGLEIVGGHADVTVRANGDGFVLADNIITNHREGLSCILIGTRERQTAAGAVVGNKVHGCGPTGSTLDHGLYAQNVGPGRSGRPGLLIEGNVFRDVAGYAVQLYPVSEQVVVRHNLIDGGGRSVRGGLVIDGPVARDALLERNTIIDTHTGAVLVRAGDGHRAVRNCFWRNPRDVVGTGIDFEGNVSSMGEDGTCPLGPVPRAGTSHDVSAWPHPRSAPGPSKEQEPL